MSKLVTLRNVSPLGYLDVPILGRQGPSPAYDCTEACTVDDEHEHVDRVDEQHDEPGTGCLKPGEKFTTTPEIADRLLEQAENFELVKAKAPARKRAAKKAAPASPAVDVVTTEKG